jgi:small GTP-binding protein
MSDRINKIKISLIGESDVGKSTIFYQYDEHEYYNDLLMTTMCDTIYSKFNYENKDFLLEIIDTPGNDRFKTITSILIKNTHIFLLIYDITNRNSFEKLDYWYKITYKNCNNDNILYLVIANKSDLYDKKIISNEEGINFAKKINAQFFEITSTSYENITKLFENIIRKYLIENRKDLLNDINNKRNEYQGKIINGKKNGFGKMNYGNGDIYEGNWKDDLRDGEGTLINNNGDKYYGIWKNDVLNEKIEIEYINGDIYKGNLKEGKKNGNGMYIYKLLNIVYECNFENDNKNGYGKITFFNKKINIRNNNFKNIKYELYEGEFQDDKIEGDGIFYYASGKIIKGTFRNNKPIKGYVIYKNNEKYNGELNGEGNKNGKGIYYKNENDYKIFNENIDKINEDIFELFKLNIQDFIYYGEFNNNKKNGNGILYMKNMFKNYDKYVIYKGNFINGLKNNNGTLYFYDKSYLIAKWRNNEINNNEDGIFYLYYIFRDFIKKLNTDEWISYINNKKKIVYGNNKKNRAQKVLYR